MASNIRTAPIVFTLNNTGAYHDRSCIIFLTFKALLFLEGSNAKKYIENLDLFKENDVLLLLERLVNTRNKEVTMNEKHFIIYNAVFIYIKKLLLNPECEDAVLFANALVNHPTKSINDVKDLVLEFITVGEQLFETKYKNSHTMTIAFNKISQQ